MKDAVDLSRGVLLLSDDRLGSYKIIGDLFLATLRRARFDVEQRSLAEYASEQTKLLAFSRSRVVIQNTIGPRFNRFPGACNVALVHHEWDCYPGGWVKSLNGFDEVWATSTFVRDTLRRSGVIVPIKLKFPALDLETIPQKVDYAHARPCRFLSCGEPHFRKGFHLLIEGFLEAFPVFGVATLTIKTSPGCEWRSPRDDIRIVTERFDRAALLGYYREFDVYVTASLGEGLGLPVAEAILAGVPVAANLWGGHRSLLKAPHFFRIPHVVAPQPFCSFPEYYAPGQQCAFSHPSAIAKILRRVAAAPAGKRKQMARAARAALLDRYGWRTVSSRFGQVRAPAKGKIDAFSQS
jgi:glycosyltransferase involved in cell wall biosynthesis